MTPEVQFLLSRRPEVSEAAFLAVSRMIKARALAVGLEAELAELNQPEALAASAHVAASGGAANDAILSLRGDADNLMTAVAAAGGELDKVANLAESSVVGVQRYSVLPGTDPIRLFFGLRRLPRLTREQFQDYWLNKHAEFGRRLIPPYTYHQLHARGDLTEKAASASGLPASTFDGIVEVHFPDMDALVAQVTKPSVAKDALEDERNFIDHSRSAFYVYQHIQ